MKILLEKRFILEHDQARDLSCGQATSRSQIVIAHNLFMIYRELHAWARTQWRLNNVGRHLSVTYRHGGPQVSVVQREQFRATRHPVPTRSGFLSILRRLDSPLTSTSHGRYVDSHGGIPVLYSFPIARMCCRILWIVDAIVISRTGSAREPPRIISPSAPTEKSPLTLFTPECTPLIS